jgi:hypothetical protein
MAEAQKMMNSPSFQKQMKKMAGTKEFKENAKQTELILKDPSQAAEAEARMEHMVRVGNDQMKKAAGGMMEDAMAAMNDPGVMAEMTKMMKDPNFQQQLNDMMKDPSFSSYADAVSNLCIVLDWIIFCWILTLTNLTLTNISTLNLCYMNR